MDMSRTSPPLPADTRPTNPYVTVSNEIDLVDLAVILIRRWRLMLVVFTLVAVLGCTAASFKSTTYQYITGITIGQQNGRAIESPEAVRAAIANMFVPAVVAETADEDMRNLAKNFKAETVRDSNVVLLKVFAQEAKADQVYGLFNEVRERLLADHGKRLEQVVRPLQIQQTALEVELGQLERDIAQLESALYDDNPLARAAVVDKILRLQDSQRLAREELTAVRAALAAITPTMMSERPQRSIDRQGASRALIVALAVVLGTMLAIFSAFFAEFASRVRGRLKD